MNVFILDKDMSKSAAMLDDAHLIAQINEATQIIMANFNRQHFNGVKIGHINHPVTVYYRDDERSKELFTYIMVLVTEYYIRFGKEHQNYFWCIGFGRDVYVNHYQSRKFNQCKTLIGNTMTSNINEIRQYISTKPHVRALKWTNRERPDWWKE